MQNAAPAPSRFFLARALAPRLQSNGRWVAINAATRGVFAIPGKDVESKLLSSLADPTSGSDTQVRRAEEILGIVRGQRDRREHGYDAWYRQLTYDYPFLDYAAHDAMSLDDDTMAGYGPQPDPAISPDGSDIEDSYPRAVLDAVRATLEFVGRREGKFGPIRYRVVPSGGARHPTTVALTSSSTADRMTWFDPASEDFVTRANSGPHRLAIGLPETAIALVIASDVRPAMWRYRDVRAFRPVLIDAGHVVRHLELELAARGWATAWKSAADLIEVAGTYAAVLGTVIASPAPLSGTQSGPAASRAPQLRGHLLTSPFVTLSSDGNGLWIRQHDTATTLRITGAGARVVAYATPSSRGDRPNSFMQIVESNGAHPDEVEALAAAGVLIEPELAREQWRLSWEWSRHDWFPSLIAHLEARRSEPDLRFTTAVAPIPPTVTDLRYVARRRRTRRSFGTAPLPIDLVEDLIELLKAAPCRVFLSSTRLLVSGRPGLYELDRGSVMRKTDPLDLSTISRIAIGQPWIGEAELVAFLLPQGGAHLEVAEWERAIIDLGRIAQSAAILVAAHLGDVGMFQTPALVDAELSAALGVAVPDGAYLLAWGSGGVTALGRRHG
jgi:hypothetical protein